MIRYNTQLRYYSQGQGMWIAKRRLHPLRHHAARAAIHTQNGTREELYKTTKHNNIYRPENCIVNKADIFFFFFLEHSRKFPKYFLESL